MRLQVSGVPSLVKIGYRGPKVSRGLHPSGYVDNLIHNVNELLKLNKDKDAARIAHTVGNKKRLEIILEAESMGIKVLNGKKPESKQPKSDEVTLKQDQK
jgi:large subunit ribosomal protein L32e